MLCSVSIMSGKSPVHSIFNIPEHTDMRCLTCWGNPKITEALHCFYFQQSIYRPFSRSFAVQCDSFGLPEDKMKPSCTNYPLL